MCDLPSEVEKSWTSANAVELQCSTQYRYTPDPGTIPEGTDVLCGVCKCRMICRRNVPISPWSVIVNPRGFVQAMGKGKSLHDVYECPQKETDWHEQVLALRKAAEDTPSAKQERDFLEEADAVLANETATKEVRSIF